MEARALMEMETEQKGIVIPFRKELDLTFAVIANEKTKEKAELVARETKARKYSAKCKAKQNHEDLWLCLSSLFVPASIFAMYLLACCL